MRFVQRKAWRCIRLMVEPKKFFKVKNSKAFGTKGWRRQFEAH
jgi:hypothetical protein